MKQLITIIIILIFSYNSYSQNKTLSELVSQGIELHDAGKYNEAITKYNEALKIDKNSTLANYELSYTYFVTQQYHQAIKYSTKALKQKSDHQHESYVILGSCFDIIGKPDKAIKIYEDGLTVFPNSNLLNYNLALTCYNQQDYDKAEAAAIKAIEAKPSHGSSHILLAATMKEKGQRVQSILPLYYFLMLEPNSNRSLSNFNSLINQLGQGVEKKDEKNINVNIAITDESNNEFSAAEMMISLLAASKYTEENKDKNDLEFFNEINKGVFGILGELKKDNSGLWWDLYVNTFYNLLQSENCEAYSYYISQSANNEIVNNWISENPDKMQKLQEWLEL